MLIPSYTPVRNSTSTCSSPCSQVCHAHKPAIKGKCRSIAPTVSSLLIGAIVINSQTELSDEEVKDIHAMEGTIKNHEVPERPTEENTLKHPQSDHGPDRGYRQVVGSCLKSHRTEDISVRENEDGVRTHFCPLDKSRDSPSRNEGEDLSSVPSKQDIEAELFMRDFSLKSEDITSLVAEKPPFSGSDEENDNSDVDASTSMIYASYENRQFVSAENSLKFLLEHQMTSRPSTKLYENAMPSWAEDSSEEEDSSLVPSSSDRSEEMQLRQKYNELEESDMEEFDRRPESNAEGFEVLKLFSDSKQTSVFNKNLLNDEDSSNNKFVEITNDNGESSLTDISVIRVEKSNTKTNPPPLETASENSVKRVRFQEQKREISKENSDSEGCPHVLDDEREITDLLKAVVEQAILNASGVLQKSTDEMLQNCESNLKEEKSDQKSDNMAAERHLLKDTSTQIKKTDDALTESNIILGKEIESGKPEENSPTFKVYINTENPAPDVSVRCKISKGLAAEPKEEIKRNFAMEPMSLHSKSEEKNEETQPDLATALRFMTEVYPNRNDDEMYFDTLSNLSDHSSEKSAKECPSTISIKHRQEKPDTDHPERGKASTTGSGPFEPIIVENQRTIKRPRNKFSKFFQSFKKRLTKKS